MNAADRKAFPQASRVVRISDAEWSSEEDGLLRQLSEVLMRRARERQPCALERLLEPRPRVRPGGGHVVFVFEEHQVQADVRGLVFEHIARISRKGNLVLNLGADNASQPRQAM